MDKVILKSEVLSWLLSFADCYRVVAPVEQEQGPAVYQELGADDKIVLDNSSWIMSPRDFLLPREETLLSVNGNGENRRVVDSTEEEKPTLLAGIRACDARAIQVLDNVYLNGPFKDPYYAAKRENLILVGTVCTEARWNCFCTSVGNPLEWLDSLDATLTDIGDRVFISTGTEAGDDLLSGGGLMDAAEADKRKSDEVRRNLAELETRSFAGKDIASAMDWDHPVWAEVAKRCLACGICNYLCPSCSCFDIQDEVVSKDCIERFRCRDTCQFSDFTRMGAGHNPRSNQLPRSRQRIMHKFSYQPEQFSLFGCTGCGRCIEACPVNIDVRAVVNEMCLDEVTG